MTTSCIFQAGSTTFFPFRLLSLPPQPHRGSQLFSHSFAYSFSPSLSLSLSPSMAENYSLFLLRAMDRLWFHQIILFSDPTSLLIPKTLKPPQLISESLTCPSSSLSLSTFPNEEISSAISPPSEEENSSPITPSDDSNNEDEKKKRPTRLNITRSRNRSLSSSPSTQKHHENHRFLGSARKLEKTMSCRGLGDLELEEVKGFIDLGFVFEKEHLSPRMMSVLPGLQRLGSYHKTKLIDVTEVTKDDKSKQEEEKRGIMRPYLSEAWLIRRPDSPLLNLRLPKVSAAADMKKHLRFWARTVASEIQQES